MGNWVLKAFDIKLEVLVVLVQTNLHFFHMKIQYVEGLLGFCRMIVCLKVN